MLNAKLRYSAAVTAALLCTAGCSSARTAAPSASPAPVITASSSLASLISRAASTECARFEAADKRITKGTQLDRTVGELAGTLNVTGPAWGRALSRAGKSADTAAVPAGENRANRIAVDIDRSSFDVDLADLDNDLGQDGRLNAAWTKTVRQLARTRGACLSG